MLAVVPVDPPRAGLVLTTLAEDPSVPIDRSAAIDLYEAAVSDVLAAVADSGCDLLVNYRDETTLPAEDEDAPNDATAEDAVRNLVGAALGDAADVRFERQVGSTRAARIGNTVTHLLEREDVSNVAIVEPTAALVRRTDLDGLAMSLRNHDVVLAPGDGAGVAIVGFGSTIDFADLDGKPKLPTLVARAAEAGLDVGFGPRIPTVDTEAGLVETLATIRAREAAGTSIPAETTAALDALGLGLSGESESGITSSKRTSTR